MLLTVAILLDYFHELHYLWDFEFFKTGLLSFIIANPPHNLNEMEILTAPKLIIHTEHHSLSLVFNLYVEEVWKSLDQQPDGSPGCGWRNTPSPAG
uniref:Uncharacterized protein n=1 Tax=Megaselia scalaris TaxID=36166 RepID=T1GES6_MEGSC